MSQSDTGPVQLARAVALLADNLGTSRAQLAQALTAVDATEPEPDLATLVRSAVAHDPRLHVYDRYLRVLVDGLPGFRPVTGPRSHRGPGWARPRRAP